MIDKGKSPVQCPRFLDFHETYRCPGHLFVTRMLDAEEPCVACDSCLSHFGMSVLERPQNAENGERDVQKAESRSGVQG